MITVTRALALSVLALSGCQRAAPQGPQPQTTELLTSAASLAAGLNDPALVVIHAERDTAARAGMQIPGARFLPMSAFAVARNGVPGELPPLAELRATLEEVGISTNSRVVIYGDPLAAGRLFFTLDYLGLGGQVSLLDGGLPAWRSGNHPLAEASTAAVRRGTLEPRILPKLLIDMGELAGDLGQADLVLLDARPAAEFSGESPGEGVKRPGHIPGAHNFFWQQALTAGPPAMLKDAAELRRLLAPSGLAPGKKVVVYCRTGVQASHLYFVLRYLGYAPRLYDGSYAEWNLGNEQVTSGS